MEILVGLSGFYNFLNTTLVALANALLRRNGSLRRNARDMVKLQKPMLLGLGKMVV